MPLAAPPVESPALDTAERIRSTDPRVRRTLRYSIIEGACYSVMVGAGETYFVPYALFLGGSNFTIGLFVALPIFVGSLSQILSERLLAWVGTRKRLIASSVALQIFSFLPMLLVERLATQHRAELLLAIVCFYWSCGLVLGPSWSSWLGDLVPDRSRGAYFGRRSRYIQISTFFSIAGSGVTLFFFQQAGREMAGFTAVFGIAAAARTASLVFLLLHWEPAMLYPPTRRALSSVAAVLGNPHQRVLIVYLAFMSFGVYVSAPYFSAFMLRSTANNGLEWSYVTFTLVNGITMFFKFVFLPLWGTAADRFGARKCLVLAAWMVSVLPLLWLCPRTDPYFYFTVVCFTQTWGGLAWAGHELCAFNFLLDSALPSERPRLVASMNIVNGCMVFLGSMTGAVAVSVAPEGIHPFLLVFLLSGLCRFAVCGTLAHRLREVRVVEKISYRSLFFRVSSVRPTIGPVLRFFVLPLRKA